MRIAFTTCVLAIGLCRFSWAEPNVAPESKGDVDVAASKVNTVPTILSVFPQHGARDVAITSEIRIRFDQPMKPGSVSLEWSGHGKNGGFRTRGAWLYDAELFEFTFPVVFKTGVTHEVQLNDGLINHSFARARPESASGFQSARGTASKPFKWSFATAALPTNIIGPKIVSIHPEPGSEIALATELRVRFDRPMDPVYYELEYERGTFGHRISLLGDVSYDASRHEFWVPLAFPANWNGEVQLRGFRGSQGLPAESRDVGFRTLREPLSAERRDSLSNHADSEFLTTLLEDARTRHQEIKSVKVNATSRMIHSDLEWGYSISSTQAKFAKEDNKFFGDVSEIMPGTATFQVGSDGGECWFRYNNGVTVCPTTDVKRQTVSIADGFGLLSGNMDISQLRLEYVGMEALVGRSFHRIRSWSDIESAAFKMTGRVGNLREWLIDSETRLVFRVRYGTLMETEFSYELVNQNFPDEFFRAPTGPNIVTSKVQPLAEGYTERFLKVSDGTNGRMSLRWGKSGVKGTSSSGLN